MSRACAHLDRVQARPREAPRCARGTPPAGRGRRPYQPRVCSRPCSPSVGDLDAVHRLAQAERDLGDDARVGEVGRRPTMAEACAAGSELLKMPEPTNTPSAPSCIMSAASAGVAMPPAVNITTGRRPCRRAVLARARRAPEAPWRRRTARRRPSSVSCLISPRMARMCRTASTTLPVPASPFERIIAAPSLMRRSASPRLVGAAHERDRELPLVDVVGLVGRRQHLGLVDVVDLERLEHLRLDEVADAGLRHDRDRDRVLDLADLAAGRPCGRRRRRGGCRRGRARAP